MRLRSVLAAMLLFMPAAAWAQQYPYAFQTAPLVLGTTAGTAAAGNDPRIVNAAPLNSPTFTGNLSTSGAFTSGTAGNSGYFGGNGSFVNIGNNNSIVAQLYASGANQDYFYFGAGVGSMSFGSGGPSTNVTANYNAARGTGTHVFNAPVQVPSLTAMTDVTVQRHLTGSGGSSPTASAGGMAGNASDLRGYVALGSGATSTTLTFATAFATTPFCVATGSSTAITVAITFASTTSMTIALSSNPGGEYVNYYCIQ